MSNQYQELKKQHYLGLLREELAGEVLAKQEIVPVQITPPAGAEGSGGYDPEEVPLQRVSEIRIQVGSIEVYLPRDAPADYLAALVKEMA